MNLSNIVGADVMCSKFSQFGTKGALYKADVQMTALVIIEILTENRIAEFETEIPFTEILLCIYINPCSKQV